MDSIRHVLTQEEVRKLEGEIDAYFTEAEFPTMSEFDGRRLICLLYEDINRWLVDQAATDLKVNEYSSTMSDLMIKMDSLKYAFRNNLRMISGRSHEERTRPYLSEDDLKSAVKTIEISQQYHRASKILYEYHNNEIELSIGSDGVIYTSETSLDSQFHALEFGSSTSAPTRNTFAFFVLCFLTGGATLADGSTVEQSDTYKSIVRRTMLRKGRLRYNLINRLAQPIYETFRNGNETLVQEWTFPWGTMGQTADFCSALSAIGLYHLISVHQTAKKASLEGGGLYDICYNARPIKLRKEISLITGLEEARVALLMEFFTYGHLTKSPDPVLQPLIPVSPNIIAFPAAMYLSSNWPRNVLSLHARVSPATFDTQSKVFEKGMIKRLTDELANRFDVSSNLIFQVAEGREEVDLVVIQRDRRIALLCELRWVLPPGDPGEVQNRLKSIRRKVSQIDRKYERIKRVSSRAEPDYLPIVIVEGYGGVQSPIPTKVPIISAHLLVRMLDLRPDLEFVHSLLCTPNWLPKAGRDFEVVRDAEPLCGKVFSQTGIRPLGTRYTDRSLAEVIDEAARMTIDQIRSIRWP